MSEKMYKVEEFKIWKGVDPDKPTWNSRGFVGPQQDMIEIMEYLQHNAPELKLRVVEYGT